MSKKRNKKRPPKRTLALPDLEQSKAAVLNTTTSKSGQRSYDRAITDFVDWYCSEPRLAFNRTAVLRYRIYLERKQYAATTINLRFAAVRRIAYEAADWSRHSARAFQWVLPMKANDGPLLPVLQPEIAGNAFLHFQPNRNKEMSSREHAGCNLRELPV
jgi:hypothetical protein